MEAWQFSLIMIDLACIMFMLVTHIFSFWYRKEKKVRRLVGDIGYWKLQMAIMNHDDNAAAIV